MQSLGEIGITPGFYAAVGQAAGREFLAGLVEQGAEPRRGVVDSILAPRLDAGEEIVRETTLPMEPSRGLVGSNGVIAIFFELKSEALVARQHDLAARENVDHVGLDIVEQALVMGDDQEASGRESGIC